MRAFKEKGPLNYACNNTSAVMGRNRRGGMPHGGNGVAKVVCVGAGGVEGRQRSSEFLWTMKYCWRSHWR